MIVVSFGPAKAAMTNEQYGLVDNWLRHIKDVYRIHMKELDSIRDEAERFDRFVELNVIEQVFDLSKTSIIQNAWRSRELPMVHGWVYDLKTGIIQDLEVSLHSKSKIPAIFNVTGKVVAGEEITHA